MTMNSGDGQSANNPPGRWQEFRVIQLVVCVILAVIAAVLIQRGQYLIGGLIGALALARIVWIFSFPGRGRAYGSRGAGRPVQELLRGMVRDEFDVAATSIGISSTKLRTDFGSGKSIAEVASAAGVSVDVVIKAMISDMSARIDQAGAEGKVSKDLADQAKSRLSMWVPRLVNGHRGEFRRSRA
jgi:hypothetical protein